MTKTKKLLILSAGFLVVGALMAGFGTALGGTPATIWADRAGVHIRSQKYGRNTGEEAMQRQEKTPLSPFNRAEINLKFADIAVIPSDGYYLEYQLSGRRAEPEWDVSEGRFVFRSQGYLDEENQGINFSLFSFGINTAEDREYVKLYVPSGTDMDRWEINLAHGDAGIKGISTVDCEMKLEFSELAVEGTKIANLNLNQKHGSFSILDSEIDNVVLNTQFSEMELKRVTARSICLEKASHGSLTAEDISCTEFNSDSEYMDMLLGGVSAETVKLKSKHGSAGLDLKNCRDITVDHEFTELELATDRGIDEYQMDIRTRYGEVSVNDETYDGEYVSEGDGAGSMKIKSVHGDVEVRTGD